MRNPMEAPMIDHNPNKPAQRHQAEQAGFDMDKMNAKEVSRRDFLKTMRDGAILGLGAAIGIKVYKNIKNENDEASVETSEAEKTPDNSTDGVDDLLNKKFNSINDDLEYIKSEIKVRNIDRGYLEKINAEIPDWESRFSALREESAKENPAEYFAKELQRLEEEILKERNAIESDLHLGA